MKSPRFYKLLLTISSVLVCQSAFAQPTGGSGVSDNDLQLNTLTTSLPFMAITPDSRAGGMGDAGTALSANSTSVYWNTSLLSFAKEKSEVSLSYTPWLRQLTNDIHLSYLAGYKQLNKVHSIGGALRYFSLGEITFTDINGDVLRDDKPSEFELVGAYAFKLADRFSIGVNGKFAYSNLTGGLTVAGVNTKPGVVEITYSKTDQFGKGCFVVFALFDSCLRPVTALMSYLRLRGGEADPLFIFADKSPLTKVKLFTHLRKLLSAAGWQGNYSLHSFRVGAATTAASLGFPDHLIKALGRWSSDAYKVYIKLPSFRLQQAYICLAASNSLVSF